jgi:fumarate reductase subunit C
MSRQPYVRPVSKSTWYLRNGRYKIYMLREVTCLLVGIYSFIMIWGLATLTSGSADEWNAFLAAQQNPLSIALHAFALIYFLVYQTFAWFKLAPKAMPIQLGETRLPDRIIIIGHYAAWLVITFIIFWFAGVF